MHLPLILILALVIQCFSLHYVQKAHYTHEKFLTSS